MSRREALKFLSHTGSEKEIKRILQIADEIQYPIRLLKMYQGFKNVIQELSRSYILAVVTSRIRKSTKSYFTFSGLEKYLRAVITYEDTKRHTPYPDPLIVAAKRLKIKPSEAVAGKRRLHRLRVRD